MIQDWKEAMSYLKTTIEVQEAVIKVQDTHIKALERNDFHLKNLLARVHRDGGDYTATHGITRSVLEADKKIANMNCREDEY